MTADQTATIDRRAAPAGPPESRAAAVDLVQSTGFDASYDRIARIAAGALGADVGIVALQDAGRQIVVGSTGVQGHSRAWRAIPAARTASLHAVERQEPVVHLSTTASVIAIPFGPDTTGAICVATATVQDWADRHVALLGEIAEMLRTEIELRRNVTIRRDTQEALLYGSLHDELTGLPNRTSFVRRLEATMARASGEANYHYAVLFLDLDRFKVVNDSLGHYAGDELLIGVASRFEAATRPEDTVARLGGDEFAILLDGIADPGDALIVAGRIQETLRTAFNLGGYEVFTSASIGIVNGGGTTTGGERPEYFLRNADMAMYRAKALGRATFAVFDRVMHRDALERLQLETDLRHAVEREEVGLAFQPVVSLETGAVTGVEALARWTHPQHGAIRPDVFIPIAEDTGLIIPLGLHLLHLGCQHALAWQGAEPLSIAVNLSARQFAQSGLIEQVRNVITSTGLPSHSLVLEVTESAVIEHPDAAIETLHALRSLGVRVYMDDFGTGYSSLNHLHRLPLDGIKIDRSFVSRMDDDPKARQLVQALASLARNLNLTTVAEGVVSLAQVEELRRLGVTAAQGELFAMPGDAGAVAAQRDRAFAIPL